MTLLCEFFKCTPSQLKQEDPDDIERIKIVLSTRHALAEQERSKNRRAPRN